MSISVSLGELVNATDWNCHLGVAEATMTRHGEVFQMAGSAASSQDGRYMPSRTHYSISIALNGRSVAIDLALSITKLGNAMSDEELKSELERLRNENAALKKGRPRASA